MNRGMRYIATKRHEVEREWTGPLTERIGNDHSGYAYGICGYKHVFTMDEQVTLRQKGDKVTAFCPVVTDEGGIFMKRKVCGSEILFMDEKYAKEEYVLSLMNPSLLRGN